MTNEQYAVLTDELRDDPLGVGYANMTDDEVAASLNEPRYSVPTSSLGEPLRLCSMTPNMPQ